VLNVQYPISFQENQLKHEDRITFDRDLSNGNNTFLPNVSVSQC
jgi:hypothetical protein